MKSFQPKGAIIIIKRRIITKPEPLSTIGPMPLIENNVVTRMANKKSNKATKSRRSRRSARTAKASKEKASKTAPSFFQRLFQ
jgi:hypothetical protein